MKRDRHNTNKTGQRATAVAYRQHKYPTRTRYRNGKICLDEYLEYMDSCKPKNPTTVSTVQKKNKK